MLFKTTLFFQGDDNDESYTWFTRGYPTDLILIKSGTDKVNYFSYTITFIFFIQVENIQNKNTFGKFKGKAQLRFVHFYNQQNLA